MFGEFKLGNDLHAASEANLAELGDGTAFAVMVAHGFKVTSARGRGQSSWRERLGNRVGNVDDVGAVGTWTNTNYPPGGIIQF